MFLTVLGLVMGPSMGMAAGLKRVLILHSFGPGFSPMGTVATEFRTELAAQFKGPLEFHEVALEMPRMATGEADKAFVAYVKALYLDGEPDLVVPCGGPAVRFALRWRAELFPSAPLLLAAVESRHVKSFTLDTNTTAVTAAFDFPGVVKNIKELWPGTTNIVVVLGNSALEAFWRAETEREFEPFEREITFTWLNELTLGEMEEKLAHLPPQSVIFYASLFIDAAGVPYEYNRALTAIHAVANAPIVGMFEEDLGQGIVGGRLLNLQSQGEATAGVAVRILNGEFPGNIQIAPMTPDKPTYDWRELQRWRVRETQLPAESQVLFRTQSFVEQYRWRIVGLLCICIIESGLIFALVRQLRQRRKTERSLRESEERMKLAADAAELGLWEWNLVTDEIWTSRPTAPRLSTDYSHFLESVHPDDRVGVAHAIAKSMNGEGDYESMHRWISNSGRVRWITARGRVEFDAGQRPVLMRGVSLDITSRKQAEERAQESERRFRLIADAAPVLIWCCDSMKLCNFFNQPWLDFTGRKLHEEIGNGWAEGVHPDDQKECMRVFGEAFDGRRPFSTEYRLKRYDGQYRWVSDHGVPRYDAEGKFLGYVGSCVDVSERKHAEAEAKRSQEELAHVSRVSTLGELAGSLAHELNQPLTAILSNTQAAQRFLNGNGTDLHEVREILADIVEEDRRAGEVIVRMRAMLKKGEPKMVPLDLNQIVGEVLRLLHSELVARGVAAITRLAPALALVRGDRVQLQQVMLNLILNACDAMKANPAEERRVTLQTRRGNSGYIEAAISDRGPGFAPDYLEHAFEPFRTSKSNGLGLGLPICRSIMEAHGGRIWLANNASGGASVRFSLPAHHQEMP